MPNDLSDEILERELEGSFCGPVQLLPSTVSTNIEALRWAALGAPEGALVVADHQTGGRGRWGRGWLSEPGRALLFSLVLRPEAPVRRLGLLTTALGVACAEAIEDLCRIPTGIKWPNDVTAEGRKLAGILVETRVTGSLLEAAIAGIGVNVFWDPLEIPTSIADRATSVLAEMQRRQLGSPPGRAALLRAILDAFEPRYRAVCTGEASNVLIASATERSDVLGRRVTVRFPDRTHLEGVAARLLPTGGLELEVNGHRQTVEGGEIEQLRPV